MITIHRFFSRFLSCLNVMRKRLYHSSVIISLGALQSSYFINLETIQRVRCNNAEKGQVICIFICIYIEGDFSLCRSNRKCICRPYVNNSTNSRPCSRIHLKQMRTRIDGFLLSRSKTGVSIWFRMQPRKTRKQKWAQEYLVIVTHRLLTSNAAARFGIQSSFDGVLFKQSRDLFVSCRFRLLIFYVRVEYLKCTFS